MNKFVTENKIEQNFYSDLACERRRADTSAVGVSYKCERCPGGNWERIRIFSQEGEKSIGRPMGNYDTLNLERLDLLDFDGRDDAKNDIATELCRLFDQISLNPTRILVVGLGNEDLTPDSVGPLAASFVKPTLHISKSDKKAFDALECSEIAVIKTSVGTSSGLDSSLIASGICQKINPDAVIAIDALASKSPKRLGASIQFCDTGIFPGSGLGLGMHALNTETLGVPVIAIGVPTVIDSRAFGSEKGGMFVAQKEINSIVVSAAKIIAGGINQAFGIDF